MECGTVAVPRVGRPRLLEGRNSAGPVTQFLAQFAERKPSRGITGRKLERLCQQIRGSREIALGLEVPRPFEATVGDQIARRQMDRLRLQNLKPRFLAAAILGHISSPRAC